MLDEIEVILKISERCNINCTYCYFFNMDNKDYKKHSPYISFITIENLIAFIIDGINEFKLSRVQIDLHGGEPLMVGKKEFSRICDTLRTSLDDIVELRLSVQTNGMLIDEEWVKIFEKYEIFVGFSIDGPQEYHDRFRVDHRNRGTYLRTIDKVSLVKKAVLDGRVLGFGAICVINPEFDPTRVYDTLVKKLGFKHIHMVLPDETHHTYDITKNKLYINYLEKLFTYWTEDDDPSISIRLLDNILFLISNGLTSLNEYQNITRKKIAFTVSSEGGLGHDDTLRNTVPDLFNTQMTLSNTRFSAFTNWHKKVLLEMEVDKPHKICNECSWQKICHTVNLSLSPIHRYKNGKLHEKTIYCKPLQAVFMHSAKYMISHGLDIEKIETVLHNK